MNDEKKRNVTRPTPKQVPNLRYLSNADGSRNSFIPNGIIRFPSWRKNRNYHNVALSISNETRNAERPCQKKLDEKDGNSMGQWLDAERKKEGGGGGPVSL